jgi:uncharacterized membrane protein (Fun14 family)
MQPNTFTYWHDSLRAKLAGYPTYAVDIILYAPLGFIVGFLVKSLGRYVIIALLVTVGLLWLADYLHIITIHEAHLKSFLGQTSPESIGAAGTSFATWAEEHIVGCIAAIVGFLIGWRLGF